MFVSRISHTTDAEAKITEVNTLKILENIVIYVHTCNTLLVKIPDCKKRKKEKLKDTIYYIIESFHTSYFPLFTI